MQRLTVKLRLRDKHAAESNRQARAVNRVWNDCNEAQRHAFETRWAWKDKWLTYRHLARATAGAGVELNLHSHTVQRVCKEYVKSRQQQKKRWLRFRDRDSLGWVPFNTGHVSFDGEASVSMASDTKRCGPVTMVREDRACRSMMLPTRLLQLGVLQPRALS